ncbi:MAG: preprotein translocase subunit SecY [Alphaproteobacteria bacterium]|nr:preprotein translocase subunit SecY [Alphaproteobacteria bacterium]PHX99056.1 MAG: preprotein translocase subunit SecY [Rhodospirillaceae bacterium]
MASAADNIAANINLGAFSKATELKRRIWFVLGALIVYRAGTFITLPGIDPLVMADIIKTQSQGVLGLFDVFAGGALSRMSIFALNIMPYISASIIIQLMSSVSPQMEQMKKEGVNGRIRLNQYTRYLTVMITALQAFGIASGLESATGANGAPAVVNPGLFFQFTTVITLVGGTMFLMWLGEQMTDRGIGQGISVLIFAGIVAGLPGALAGTLELGRTGALSSFIIILMGVGSIATIAFIIFMELGQRRILVQYPKRQVGARVMGGESSHLPLKVNTAGVIPPIFASSLLLLPLTIAGFQGAGGGDGGGILNTMGALLGRGQPLYMILYSVMIIFFAFFYTAVVFNPSETAENLRKYGGFVPGIRPGKNTAEYLDYVLTRLTVVGGIYLIIVCLIPEFLISKLSVPFYFGGTSLLIVVNVTINTMQQVQSHLLAHQYEGLLKKARLRGKK